MTDSREPELHPFTEGDTIVDLTPPPLVSVVDGEQAMSGLEEEPTTISRTEEEVASLVQEGLPLVKQVARKLAQQVGGLSDVDELVSVGQTALFEAARAYDPTLSPFPPYATNRIRWAMVDSVRHTHGRASSARASALGALQRVAEAPLDGPADEPLTSETSYRTELKRRLATDAAALFVGLASSPRAEEPVEPEESAEIVLMRRRAGAALREAMAKLPERHREIVERHYFGGERFDHIATSLGVSKSWLSRLHAQAIEELGERLRDH